MKIISVFAMLLLLAQGKAAQTRAPRRAALTNQASSQPSQPRRYIDDATRAALEKIIEIKNQIASVDARVAAADREAAEIAADQARLRENIKALSKETEARQLIARYVAKATEQETRIEQITSEKRVAAVERAQLQSELDAAIRALAIDRKL